MDNKLFGGFLEVSSRALDLRSSRQGLIQTNIANLETPGYKTQRMPFQEVMARAVTNQAEMVVTDPGHIRPVSDGGQVLHSRREDRPVDLEEEMVKLSENQLMYELTTRLTGKKFEALRYVIDEGGR